MAIAGAGPSLEKALESSEGLALIQGRPKNKFLLLTTDTALGVLQARNIQPDIILTLDSQLASYHHFVPALDPRIPLVADLACLPVVSTLPNPIFFFLSSHPLHRLIKPFLPWLLTLDTSLGHVVGIGLRLAERLGARRTLLWGADYSYPQGKLYARDTYTTPYFLQRSCRLIPFESLQAAFLFRTDSLIRQKTDTGILYTNQLLLSYKEAIEHQAPTLRTALETFPGLGLPINLRSSLPIRTASPLIQPPGHQQSPSFLTFWEQTMKELPLPHPQQNIRTFLKDLPVPAYQAWQALWPLAFFELRYGLHNGVTYSPQQILMHTWQLANRILTGLNT